MKKRLRIIISIVVAALIVTAGFWLSRGSQSEKNIAVETSGGEEYSISNTNWKDSLKGLLQRNVEPTEEPSISIKELTETEKLAGNFASNYFNLKGSGPISAKQGDLIVNSALNSVESIELKDDYSIKDISLVPSNSATFRQYGNALGVMLISNYPEGELSERVVISDALKNEDPSKLKELLPIIKGYRNIRDDLLNIPVPKDLSKDHLEFINGTNNVAKTLEVMTTIFEDPLPSMQILKAYSNEILRIAISMSQIYKTIKDSNPGYKQSEGGYYFLYGI